MVDPGHLLSLACGPAPFVQNTDDIGGKNSFRLVNIGVWPFQIPIDVAATSYEFDLFSHHNTSFNRFRCSLN